MDFEEVKSFIRKRDYIFSEHADEERIKDKLTIEEVEEAILAGEVVEERLDDPRGESRLVAGRTQRGKWIHTAIGIRFERPVLVTIYKPSPAVWIRGKIRRRKRND